MKSSIHRDRLVCRFERLLPSVLVLPIPDLPSDLDGWRGALEDVVSPCEIDLDWSIIGGRYLHSPQHVRRIHAVRWLMQEKDIDDVSAETFRKLDAMLEIVAKLAIVGSVLSLERRADELRAIAATRLASITPKTFAGGNRHSLS